MKYRLRISLLILIWLLFLGVAVVGTALYSVSNSMDNNARIVEAGLQQAQENAPLLIIDELVLRADYDGTNLKLGEMVGYLQENGQEEKVPSEAHLKKYMQLIGASYIAVVGPDDNTVASVGEPVAEGATPHKNDYKATQAMTTTSACLTPEKTLLYEVDLMDNYRLRYEISGKAFNNFLKKSVSWRTIMKEMKLSGGAYYTAVSKDDGKILLHPDEEMIGKDVTALGYASMEEFEKDYSTKREGFHWKSMDANAVEAGDYDNTIVSGLYDYDSLYIICNAPNENFLFFIIQACKQLPLLFAIGTLLVLLYVLFHFWDNARRGESARKDKDPEEKMEEVPEMGRGQDAAENGSTDASKFLYDWSFTRKLIACSIVVLLLFGVVSTQMQMLSSMAQTTGQKAHAEQLKEDAENNNKRVLKSMDKWYRNQYIRIAQMAAYVTALDKQFVTRPALKKLTEQLDVEGIYLFKGNGKVAVTSTNFDHLDLYQDEEEQMSKTFRPLLDGWETSAWTPIAEPDTANDNYYAGVSIRNDKDLSDGCIGVVGSVTDGLMDSSKYSVYSDLVNMAYLKNANNVLLTRAQVTGILFLMAVMAVCLMLMTIIGGRERRKKKDPMPEGLPIQPDETEIDGQDSGQRTKASRNWFQMVTGAERDIYFYERWKWNRTPLMQRTAEQKMFFILKLLVLFAGLMIAITYAGGQTGLAENSITKNLFDGNWTHGFNLYALTSVELLVIMIVALIIVLKRLLFLIAFFVSPRGETICHLVGSLITYAAVFYVLFKSLLLFGFDTRTLLASVGIIGLAITWGAQNVIADILAGFFLIFEDAIHVGDYITVGNVSGFVTDIGVRMTKIKTVGTITTINNSDLKNLENKSYGDAYAVCTITIDYNEDLETVESIIACELPDITAALRDQEYFTIKSDVNYNGVSSLGEIGYELNFNVSCAAHKAKEVARALNAEIFKMCTNNNISMAQPHIVSESPETRQ